MDLSAPPGPFTTPISKTASLSIPGSLPSLGSSVNPIGQRPACFSSLSGVQRVVGTEGTVNLCHVLPASPSWSAQTARRPASCPQPVIPPGDLLHLRLSFPSKVARPSLGSSGCQNMASPFLSKEFTPAQGYYLSFGCNGVERVTDITNQG